ncbi:MAG: hypothetical protein ACLP05_07335 [Candidatus Kryptoniota bacterium]
MKHILRFLLAATLSTAYLDPLLAQWVQTSGTHGQVNCLAINGSNIFAGGNGVFLSTNSGTSWTAVDSGLAPYTVVVALAVSGNDIFAGTNGNGVYLSTNNGTSWIVSDSGLTDGYVFALAISGDNIFAGTDVPRPDTGGVYLSTNSGTSWTAVDSGLASEYLWDFAISGSNIFAGTWSGGIFVSTNSGKIWTAADSGLTDSIITALAISGGNIFAGTPIGVFLSTNNGTIWTAAKSGLPDGGVSDFATSGNNIFASTPVGVFLSTNSGTSWIAFNSGLTEDYYGAHGGLVVSDSNIFVADSSGVWRRPLSEIATAVRDTPRSELPSAFSLEQNYPNPFNPTTFIGYLLPTNSLVTLKVYDVLGREVKVLVSEREIAGTHSVSFSAGNPCRAEYISTDLKQGRTMIPRSFYF